MGTALGCSAKKHKELWSSCASTACSIMQCNRRWTGPSGKWEQTLPPPSSNPTVTGILKRMERKGLITRVVGSRDRRCKEVRLTEKCARLGERLHPKAGTMIDQMFQGFTQEEFDTLNCLLRRLLENCGQVQEEKHPCKALAAVSKIMYSGGTV